MKIHRFFLQFFFKLLPKFSNLICILMIVSEKSHQNLSDYASSFYSKEDINLIKNEIISSVKMRNLGNYIYDYDHSFFGKDF